MRNRKLISCIAVLLLLAGSCQNAELVRPPTVSPVVSFDIALASAKAFDTQEFSNGPHVEFRGNEIRDNFAVNGINGSPAMYVFNLQKGGTLIFSADYRMTPLLAYIPEGEMSAAYFTSASSPDGFRQWVSNTKVVVNALGKSTFDVADARKNWGDFFQRHKVQEVISGKLPYPGDGPTDPTNPTTPPAPGSGCTGIYDVVYGPLVTCTWGQLTTYNEAVSPICGTATPTGCVATAMAQILFRWKPTSPANYQYSTMPKTQGNSEVQRLMRDIGTAVNMHYDCMGSGVTLDDCQRKIPPAITTQFGMATATYGDYNQGTAIANIQAAWPVILIGAGHSISDAFNGGSSPGDNPQIAQDSGHAWILDGYKYTLNSCTGATSTYLFHTNWGWHEVKTQPGFSDGNGWYANVSFSDVFLSASGGESTYTPMHMVSNIHPAGAVL